MSKGPFLIWPTPIPITYGTPLSGFQLDATASSGTIQVPLDSYYNVYGIYSTGPVYSTYGFDNDGYSYSSSTLGSTLVWNGMTFNIGPPNAPDAVATPTATPVLRKRLRPWARDGDPSAVGSIQQPVHAWGDGQ